MNLDHNELDIGSDWGILRVVLRSPDHAHGRPNVSTALACRNFIEALPRFAIILDDRVEEGAVRRGNGEAHGLLKRRRSPVVLFIPVLFRQWGVQGQFALDLDRLSEVRCRPGIEVLFLRQSASSSIGCYNAHAAARGPGSPELPRAAVLGPAFIPGATRVSHTRRRHSRVLRGPFTGPRAVALSWLEPTNFLHGPSAHA